MDDSYVEDALDTAEQAFQDTRGQSSETDLDVSDETLVQLRKACRLLEAARTLWSSSVNSVRHLRVMFIAQNR